jgi:TolB-like protein
MAGEIFISYRRADRDKAEALHRLLKERGVEAWYDAKLATGEDWRTSTAKALERASIFVLLFSQAASESDDIIKELGAATFEKKLVIPVRIENIRPKGAFLYELATRNWFDAFENTEARFAMLADQLAEVVRRGPDAAAAAAVLGAPLSKDAQTPRWLKRPAVVAGLAVATLAAIAGAIAFLQPAKAPVVAAVPPPPRPERVAFFGFAAAGDEAVEQGVATRATDAAFVNLNSRHIDTAARAEIALSGGEARMDKARELGARYVLSGDVRKDGGKVRIAMRVEDAPSRLTVWEQTIDGEASAGIPLGLSAADRIVDMTSCISQTAYTSEASPQSDDALKAAADACAALLVNGSAGGVGGIPRFTALLAEMAQKKLGGPDTDAALAYFSAMSVGLSSPAQQPTILKQAADTLARAMKVRPDSFATIAARIDLELDRTPPARWMPEVERGLQRTPRLSESYWYNRANRLTGFELLALGRVQDASRYFKAAKDADPMDRQAQALHATSVAMTGAVPVGELQSWDEQMADLLKARPDEWIWEQSVATAILYGRGNADKLLALAPSTLPDYIVPCYRNLKTGLKQVAKAARLAAAKKAEACLTEFDSPQMIVQAASLLGDLDAAFALVDTPKKAGVLLRVYYAPWFTPATKAMRADPRFLPLMQTYGYLDYWKQTKTQPDVCATGAEKDIPLCLALR